MDLRYDLCHEDYDEFPLGDEKSKEAYTKRISDAFKMPFPDREKSMIGPEVVNTGLSIRAEDTQVSHINY